jgi:hypothetical protein
MSTVDTSDQIRQLEMAHATERHSLLGQLATVTAERDHFRGEVERFREYVNRVRDNWDCGGDEWWDALKSLCEAVERPA